MAELSLAAKLLACRLCHSANPGCGKCCKTCVDTCNGEQPCYHDLPEKELVNRAHILRDQEESMRKRLEVPVSEAEKQDPALHMEMETLRAEREENQQRQAQQAAREGMIAQTHEMIGRIQGFKAISEFADVGRLVWLKQVKDSKIYRDLPNVGTWEKFCNYIGLSRQKVDEDISNLNSFGEQFLTTVGSFSIGYRELRKLRQLTHDGTVQVQDNAITIEGETIPIDPDHSEDLQAAIEKIITSHAEIKKRVNKLEKNFNGAVKEETQGLNSEIKAFKERVKQLEIYEPNEKDREWCVKQMAAIEEAAGAFQIAVAKFVIDPRLKDDRHLQAKVSAHLQEAELSLQDLRTRLDEVIDMFND